MDWDLAITRNRDDLLRMLAMLLAAAGIVSGGVVALLPRRVRLCILRDLRPTESALRRLLLVIARRLSVTVRSLRPIPAGAPKPRSKRERAPSFPLVEPLPRAAKPAPKYGPMPRISFFDGFDPVLAPTPPEPSPDDAVEAEALCRRLLAVQSVLEDLPKHARRLALWQARQDRLPTSGRTRSGRTRSGRTRPLRPGRPPGHRTRHRQEVDDVLSECHVLALQAMEPPDTS